MLPYETIFSCARSRYTDMKETSLDESDLIEIYTERLHLAVGNPRIRKLFSELVLDDNAQIITYTLRNSVDEYSDDDFVTSLLAIGMVIEWLRPQVDSIMFTSVMIGGKEEKKLLDNHSGMISRLDSLKKELHKIIRDYGYMHNSYINGDS